MYYFIFGIIMYFLLLSILTKKYRLVSEISSIIIFTFITFMIGLRYGVGIDYFTYEEGFNIRYDLFSWYEYLYNILRYVIKIQFDKFYYLTFLMILITNIFVYLGLKKRKVKGIYLILAIFIYSSNVAIIFMNLMRQGVAVAIFFYASTFIKEKKFKKYFVFILIGMGFHLSMLFLLPLYFIKTIRFSNVSYLFFIFLSYIFVYTRLAQIIINFIALRLPFYSKIYYNNSFLLNQDVNLMSFGVLINVIFIYTLSYFLKKGKCYKCSLEEHYYKIGTVINVLSLATFMFDRIGIYFFIFGISCIPNMIRDIENKNIKLVFGILSIVITASFFINNLFINPQNNMLEYKSIFNMY